MCSSWKRAQKKAINLNKCLFSVYIMPCYRHTKHVEESVLDTLEQIRTLPTNKMLSMVKNYHCKFL